MSIRNDFRTYLLTKTAITTLVGADDPRIYPGFVPQGVALPHVVLNTISDVPDHDCDGANTWAVARIQVDAYGRTPDEADAVIEQIRLACDGKTGTMGGSTVHWCFKEDGDDTPEPAPANEVRRRHRTRNDYRLAYVQSLPTL